MRFWNSEPSCSKRKLRLRRAGRRRAMFGSRLRETRLNGVRAMRALPRFRRKLWSTVDRMSCFSLIFCLTVALTFQHFLKLTYGDLLQTTLLLFGTS